MAGDDHSGGIHPEVRAAYALAGSAVIASRFGIGFGVLSLSRDFVPDLSRRYPREQALMILYAGYAAEARLVPHSRVRHPAAASPHFHPLQGALAAHTGEIDDQTERRAHLDALAILRQPGNWAAVEALAARLAAGEALGHFTARRIMKDASSRAVAATA